MIDEQGNIDLMNSYFAYFEKLDDSQKGEIAKKWTREIKHQYLTRNPVMSEEKFFEQLDKIVTGEYGL